MSHEVLTDESDLQHSIPTWLLFPFFDIGSAPLPAPFCIIPFFFLSLFFLPLPQHASLEINKAAGGSAMPKRSTSSISPSQATVHPLTPPTHYESWCGPRVACVANYISYASPWCMRAGVCTSAHWSCGSFSFASWDAVGGRLITKEIKEGVIKKHIYVFITCAAQQELKFMCKTLSSAVSK